MQLARILGKDAVGFDVNNLLGVAYMRVGENQKSLEVLRLGIGGPKLHQDDDTDSVVQLSRWENLKQPCC